METENCNNGGVDRSTMDDEILEDPPVLVQDLLKKWDVSTGKMTHCMIALSDKDETTVSCASSSMVSRFCWFASMDHKGAIPKEIRDVIYLLHMTQKYCDGIRVGVGRQSEKPFEISKAEPFAAHTFTEQRASFHKIIVDGEIITMPLLKIRIYIENAVTGGAEPKSKFFAFLVVDTPITFDLVDMIERSCNQTGTLNDRIVSEEMKRMWVNVACSHRSFGAYGIQDKESFMNISFKDLFDPDSEYCFWKRFRISICIRDARRYMWLWASNQKRTKDQIENINVRFMNIDKVVGGRCSRGYFDDAWAQISDFCASRYYQSFLFYKEEVRIYNASKKNGKRRRDDSTNDGMSDFDGGASLNGEAQEMPTFTPFRIFSYPTMINFESDETADLMTGFAVRSEHRTGGDNVDQLIDHMKMHPGTIEMCGFPPTELMTVVDSTMLLPQGNTYISYTDWLIENKDCDLPNDITMIVLMCMYQKNLLSNPTLSMMPSSMNSFPKNVITACDLRMVLHASDTESAMSMLYNRARKIYQRCEQGITSRDNGTQRVIAFSRYIESTAIPLGNATAKSDNGTNGGKDSRVSVLNDIGEFVPKDEGDISFSSYMSYIFTEGIEQVLRDFGMDNKWNLNECPESLLHSLLLYNATLVNANRNYNLKGNNSQLITMIWISDAGLSISYNESNIEMSKNGIGHTLHVADFNRCNRELGLNGEDDTNKSKKWGAGVDKTVNVYKETQHPRNNKCPLSVDISSFPDIDSWIGSSEQGLWNTYTELVTRNGKRLNTITQVPPLVYCTELPVSDNRGIFCFGIFL